jgi:hypothetical protein
MRTIPRWTRLLINFLSSFLTVYHVYLLFDMKPIRPPILWGFFLQKYVYDFTIHLQSRVKEWNLSIHELSLYAKRQLKCIVISQANNIVYSNLFIEKRGGIFHPIDIFNEPMLNDTTSVRFKCTENDNLKKIKI